jgi:AcrR family transcriptional regulator
MAFTERSAEARARIVSVAREHFQTQGYAATLRNIAFDAKINVSMVIRYFGSKEGLLALSGDFSLDMPDLAAISKDKIAMTMAIHLISPLEGMRKESLIVLLRACLTNEHARRRVHELFDEQILAALRPICDDEDLEERVAMFSGQIIGLIMERYVLKLPYVRDLPAARFLAHVAALAQTCCLDPLPDRHALLSPRQDVGAIWQHAS